MVLPIPVRVDTGEGAVTFFDFHDYAAFFDDLRQGFPMPAEASFSFGCRAATSMARPRSLPVVSVGNFEASFVPTVADFARLDERFRLPLGTWEKLPAYRSYGFAVFKLSKGESKTHPMAFSFPRRDITSLFFPTVHIHDGQVHHEAHFEHVLYCQSGAGENLRLSQWRESPQLAHQFMQTDKTKGLILGDRHCYQRAFRGLLENRDIRVGARV